MFWRFGGYANISTLDSILDKQDVTVEELLDESDLIQELKQQNSKLIEFLRDEPVLQKLLNYVTADSKPEEDAATDESKEKEEEKADNSSEKTSPGISFFGKGKARSRSKSMSKRDADGETEQEKKEARRKKYAYVACEVLSSEVWSITEALVDQQDHLREFWQYLYRPAPLDPLQAGYFTKVNEALLDKKTEEMLAFFKSLDGIVPAMLQHVDCPMVMDLLLKIISLEKQEGGQGIVDWLQSQNLMPLLLGYLSPEHTSATQTSAGDFLKAIITISANATTQDQSVIGPNELTRELVSDKCIKTLINNMLLGGNPLTVGVGIIIEVIRKNNSDYDLDNQVGPEPKTSDPIYLGTLLRQFAEHVPDFMSLIRSPTAKKPDLKAACGRKIEPLGFDRFKTCELMAELLHCSNMGLLNERGAEQDVRKRDAERERLKAEGKLTTPRAPTTPSHDEFGSSVDSHGFHLAERPSDEEMNEKPEEIRRLEVQNASDEDGFEKVSAPESADELPDEVTFDDLNEKVDHTIHGGLPLLEKVEKRDPTNPENRSPIQADAVPRPLSPNKASSPNKQLHFDPPPTQAADSPTTAGVTDKIHKLDVDEDTVMSEFGEDMPERGKHTSLLTQQLAQQPLSMEVDDDGPSELERALARPEDKPAPLNFAKKDTAKEEHDASAEGERSQNIDESVATLQGQEATQANGERAAYETELDGSPVVGDLLKLQFVEHQVVPTILDFFFRFPWNNFLHNVVYDVVQQVFNGTLERGYNRTLAFDLFRSIQPKDGKTVEELGLLSGKDITDRILDGQKASDLSQQEKNMRLGYMGHLTLIAEEVCKFGNRHPPDTLDKVVMDRVNRDEWIQYVEGTLAETRDKDNAVLGGVRPENAIGVRGMGMGVSGLSSGFTNNTANTLANAGLGGSGAAPADSMALAEGGQSFEINSGTMLSSGFNDNGDDDEEMEDEATLRERERRAAFAEDEQTSAASSLSPEGDNKNSSSASVAPLNIPPSRARRTLAQRLAQRNNEAQGSDSKLDTDPDAADSAALQTSEMLPDSPPEIDLGDAEVDSALRIRSTGAASKFSGLFGDDNNDSSSDEEGHASRDQSAEDYHESSSSGRVRRPSTTEAKERTPLDVDVDEEEELLAEEMRERMRLGQEGGFLGKDGEESSSDEDEGLIEIKTRRTS